VNQNTESIGAPGNAPVMMRAGMGRLCYQIKEGDRSLFRDCIIHVAHSVAPVGFLQLSADKLSALTNAHYAFATDASEWAEYHIAGIAPKFDDALNHANLKRA